MMSDFTLARKHFGSVDIHAYHLLSLAAVPFRRAKNFPRVVAILDRVDAALFRWLPFTARYAWYAVAVMSDPHPVGAAGVGKNGAGD